MSSSPSSSSSNGPAPATQARFASLADVKCPVSVMLGTGTISVRQVLALARNSVVRLHQSAGDDLQVQVKGVLLARGEVVVVEDSAAIRLTDIARRQPSGDAR